MRRIFLLALLLTFLAATAPAVLASEAKPGLDDKIGQMIMVGFRGLILTDGHPIVRDIRAGHVGGVILFDYDVPTQTYGRNIATGKQLKTLCSSLQARAAVPLFIAVDQEGGRVSRLKEKNGFPPTLSQRQLGARDDLSKTGTQAGITAKTLAGAGINVNFAPVVDLDVNPENPIIGKLERSFSGDPSTVTRHALAVIDAHRQYGILTAPKHFPGHGSASEDTHEGLVDVTGQWSAIELDPYRNLIRLGKADMIMTAHIFNGNLDPLLPATLSNRILTDLLRREMGFRGVIVSDDMQMKAIAARYGMETAVRLAILAGVDMLVFANNSVYEEDIARRVAATIRSLVMSGDIAPERIDESWQRITALKATLRK